MRARFTENAILGGVALLLGLFVVFVWAPLDSDSGVAEKVRGRWSVGDALAPTVEESGGELTFAGDEVPLGGGVGMGLRESDTELKEKFDAAITSMKEDGTLNALIEEWGVGEPFE